MDPIQEQSKAINNRERGMYFLYMEHPVVIRTLHWGGEGQSVTTKLDVTLVYNLLQYFDIILYTITILYLVCLTLLRAIGETSYGIRVGFIGSTHGLHYFFMYLFVFEIQSLLLSS
jgi:hypothetical protein